MEVAGRTALFPYETNELDNDRVGLNDAGQAQRHSEAFAHRSEA